MQPLKETQERLRKTKSIISQVLEPGGMPRHTGPHWKASVSLSVRNKESASAMAWKGEAGQAEQFNMGWFE